MDLYIHFHKPPRRSTLLVKYRGSYTFHRARFHFLPGVVNKKFRREIKSFVTQYTDLITDGGTGKSHFDSR
jgi:hypothetical protein